MAKQPSKASSTQVKEPTQAKARTKAPAKQSKGAAGKASRSKAKGRSGESPDTETGSSDEAPSFEAALEALETTVGRLEAGEMPLEEALALFERGVALSRACTATLEAAEKRVEILVADRAGEDEWTPAPFEDGELDDEDEEDDFEDDLEDDEED